MRQKIFIKQTCRALLLYFICLTIAVAIDLIFFKVKNMYHTPALVAIFSGWVYLGLIQKFLEHLPIREPGTGIFHQEVYRIQRRRASRHRILGCRRIPLCRHLPRRHFC